MNLNLIVDSKQALNDIRLFASPYTNYIVDLTYSNSDIGTTTCIIYPFDIAFHQNLVDSKKNNFSNNLNSSLTTYNLILYNGILNKLFSLIDEKSPTLLRSKIDSIFYIVLRWLKDYNEFEFPEIFNFGNSNLIVCKYCLRQFSREGDNRFCVKKNHICNSTCSNDYTNFLNDELVAHMLISKYTVATLYNVASNMIVNSEDISHKEALRKSKLYLHKSIEIISKHFFNRLIEEKYSLISKETYKSYEHLSNIKLAPTNTYYKEPELLKQYKEAYSLGQNDKIDDLLNNYDLPLFKKLKVIGGEVGTRAKHRKL